MQEGKQSVRFDEIMFRLFGQLEETMDEEERD